MWAPEIFFNTIYLTWVGRESTSAVIDLRFLKLITKSQVSKRSSLVKKKSGQTWVVKCPTNSPMSLNSQKQNPGFIIHWIKAKLYDQTFLSFKYSLFLLYNRNNTLGLKQTFYLLTQTAYLRCYHCAVSVMITEWMNIHLFKAQHGGSWKHHWNSLNLMLFKKCWIFVKQILKPTKKLPPFRPSF